MLLSCWSIRMQPLLIDKQWISPIQFFSTLSYLSTSVPPPKKKRWKNEIIKTSLQKHSLAVERWQRSMQLTVNINSLPWRRSLSISHHTLFLDAQLYKLLWFRKVYKLLLGGGLCKYEEFGWAMTKERKKHDLPLQAGVGNGNDFLWELSWAHS